MNTHGDKHAILLYSSRKIMYYHAEEENTCGIGNFVLATPMYSADQLKKINEDK